MKTVNGNVYWFLREMARVEGKPKMVSDGYLGSAEDIGKPLDAKEAAAMPEDAGASVGTHLALAALNRVAAPTSKLVFADWWTTTAADRFTKITASVPDHRKFWDAMHALSLKELAQVEEHIAVAQCGKAEQKRTDLRLVVLGLVITRDGGIPLLAHAYLGNKRDVTQFPAMIDALGTRHCTLAETAGTTADPEVAVVFDAGQNSASKFASVTDTELAFVGSIPPAHVSDLLVLPAQLKDPHGVPFPPCTTSPNTISGCTPSPARPQRCGWRKIANESILPSNRRLVPACVCGPTSPRGRPTSSVPPPPARMEDLRSRSE